MLKWEMSRVRFSGDELAHRRLIQQHEQQLHEKLGWGSHDRRKAAMCTACNTRGTIEFIEKPNNNSDSAYMNVRHLMVTVDEVF